LIAWAGNGDDILRSRASTPTRLAEFRAGLRRRYTDEEILAELRASAARLGRSPTMREFAGDPEAGVHPQTVIEHFGTWNAAKRAAGLQPRRFISREELVAQLRELGEELGRTPTVRDIEERRSRMASKSLIWHTFGSLAAALKEAGFDVPVGEERLERAIADGAVLARELGHLPKMAGVEGRARAGCDASLRVAGLPPRRRQPGRLVGVPVPRQPASAGGGRRGARGRDGRGALRP
jgi:hypothetical protein